MELGYRYNGTVIPYEVCKEIYQYVNDIELADEMEFIIKTTPGGTFPVDDPEFADVKADAIDMYTELMGGALAETDWLECGLRCLMKALLSHGYTQQTRWAKKENDYAVD